jgi:phage-related minor tail protein
MFDVFLSEVAVKKVAMKPSGLGPSVSPIEKSRQSHRAVDRSSSNLNDINPVQAQQSRTRATKPGNLREPSNLSHLDDFLHDVFDADTQLDTGTQVKQPAVPFMPEVPAEPLPLVMSPVPTHPPKKAELKVDDDLAKLKTEFTMHRSSSKLAMLTATQARQIVRQISSEHESSSPLPSVAQQSWSSSSTVTPKNKQLLRLEKNVADLSTKLMKAEKTFEEAAKIHSQLVFGGGSEKSREFQRAKQAFGKADKTVRQVEDSLEQAEQRLEQARTKLR